MTASKNIGSGINAAEYWSAKQSTYKVLGASGQVKASDGVLDGIFTSSGTATILIYDTTGTTGTIMVDSFVSAPSTYYNFKNAKFDNGCYVSLTNAGTVTVFYK